MRFFLRKKILLLKAFMTTPRRIQIGSGVELVKFFLLIHDSHAQEVELFQYHLAKWPDMDHFSSLLFLT